MPLILPGNVASATASTGYTVANSCRFNDGDSADLSLTLGSSLDPRSLYTFSCWIKRGVLGTTQNLFDGTDGTYPTTFSISSADKLVFYDTGENATFTSDAVLRDSAAWYHLVCRVDTSQASNENRVKFYINGVQATTTQTNTLTQDGNISWGKEVAHYVGGRTNYFDGYMAEVVWITASSLAPTSFGEFDEDSPTIWKPIDVSELTFGTHGFYLDFEASDNLGNDANGGTDWTETNLDATDQATDTPTNNFATMNPLDNYYANSTFSEGNCTIVQGSSTYAHNLSTIAVTAGKWYAEAKLTTDSEHALVGITDTPAISVLVKILGSAAHDYSIKQANGDLFNNVGDDPSNDATNYAAAYAQNDIIGIALDCDNNKLYFSKGGAWSDGSGSWDSTTFNASVGAITITAPASTDNGHYFFASGDYGGAVCNWEWNFGGCPPNTISSGNADADGYGNFEYAVPSGYYALCTKNIGAYGG